MAWYSQAVRKANILVLAGQGGFDATTDKLVGPGIEEQTRQGAFGVVSMRVFLTDHSELADMNSVYGEFFSEPYPARTTVFCGLAPGMEVVPPSRAEHPCARPCHGVGLGRRAGPHAARA